MYVELLKFDSNTNTERVVARCTLDEKTGYVHCEGDQVLIENLEKQGVIFRGDRLFPKDGKEFLEGLEEAFDYPSLYASELKQ